MRTVNSFWHRYRSSLTDSGSLCLHSVQTIWCMTYACCSLGVWNLVCARQRVPTCLTSNKALGHCVCNELLWWTALHIGCHSSMLEVWSVSCTTSREEESSKLWLVSSIFPHVSFHSAAFAFYFFAVISLSWVLWVLANHWTCGWFGGRLTHYITKFYKI